MNQSRKDPASHRRNQYRWNVAGGTYFVTTATRDRVRLFNDADNVQLLLDALQHARLLHPFTMIGYAILPDHLHLLIGLDEDTRIDRLMRACKWSFTRLYKTAHGITDHVVLWQQGYWDHLVRNEHDLEQCLAYIHYNPVKHGLCADAMDYPYTSLAEHVHREWHGAETESLPFDAETPLSE